MGAMENPQESHCEIGIVEDENAQNVEEGDCEMGIVADENAQNVEEGDNVVEAFSSLVVEDVSWFSQFRHGSNPWMARYVYTLMFLVVNLLAWAVRDYGLTALTRIIRPEECWGGKDCLSSEGVLRVSLACFVFYVLMFLSTVGTSKLHSPREQWHSCWWIAKICLWVILIIASFLVPPDVIGVYGDIAHFGAGHVPELFLVTQHYHSVFRDLPKSVSFFHRVFLLIQLVSIIRFIIWLNGFFKSGKYEDKCHIHVMLLAIICYLISIVGITMMYIWYAPQLSCLVNIFFITWTLILLQLMTSISIHPKVNAGILAPGLMGLYIVFSCWCAIRSEPPEESCGKRDTTVAGRTDWLTIISFVIAVLAIVIATFSTGIDSKCFQFRKLKKQDEEDDVPYGYGFFHLVFATGAMYFAMLLIGWNSHHNMRKWTIDVGWTSTWVRIINEWLAVCVYIWIVVAPVVWKSRREATT